MLVCSANPKLPASCVEATRCEGNPIRPVTGLRFFTYSGSLLAIPAEDIAVISAARGTSKHPGRGLAPGKINATLLFHLLHHKGLKQGLVTGIAPVLDVWVVFKMKTAGPGGQPKLTSRGLPAENHG